MQLIILNLVSVTISFNFKYYKKIYKYFEIN